MNQVLVIAEIGNCHFGDLQHAKQLILAAKNAGADLVKSQAFIGDDITGSMPVEFYRKCAFTFNEYLELIIYGRSIDINVFYSIFSPELMPLQGHQYFHKLSASHIKNRNFDMNYYDKETTFASIPNALMAPKFREAKPMFVSEYLDQDPPLENIQTLTKIYNRPIGYSDHSKGIQNCVRAVEYFGAVCLEKHMTIQKDFKWKGVLYRDCIHSSTPIEFGKLVNIINRSGMN